MPLGKSPPKNVGPSLVPNSSSGKRQICHCRKAGCSSPAWAKKEAAAARTPRQPLKSNR